MRILSPLSLLHLLVSAVIILGIVGCSSSENKSEKESVSAVEQTPDDEAFAKTHGAAWITTKLDPVQSKQFTVDFQDGLFSQGSTLACEMLASDVYRENGALILTGPSFSNFGEFEIEITTNMLSSIRIAGGRFSFIRVAFKVELFKRIESGSSDDSSERDLIHGKAVAVEPITTTAETKK